MGLALVVGILSDLKKEDPEGFAAHSGYFDGANALLAANKAAPHEEPTDGEVWDAEMYGYSGLHYLRRLAAHVDMGGKLPGPGDENSSDDERLAAYFQDVIDGTPGFLQSLLGKKSKFLRGFDHLIVHSDAEGFYLPADFPEVLFGDDQTEIPGGMVGSAPRLLKECERLARILEIPPDITKDSEELWVAADTQGEGDAVWQQYGVESFTCVALIEGCRKSIETGAALVFS